jgi:hypothetical protein
MSIRPSSLALLALLTATPALAGPQPFSGMASSVELDDAAFMLGLCSRHMGRAPADAVLAKYNAAHPLTREARAKSNLAFNELFRRGQGEGGRVPMEYAYCSRQVTTILRKFGAG